MTKRIVNLDDLKLDVQKYSDVFEAHMASIAPLVGGRKLGYRLTVLPPGKKAWPYHAHLANEEMFFILSGSGLLRYAGAEYPIRAGDVIAAPAGTEAEAHQIYNNSAEDLKYLCVSTMVEPDIMLYPDSGKFGAFAGAAPGGAKDKRTFTYFGRLGTSVDYWSDEGK
ncbi:MAG: cupin domain-containing protein [Sulfurifustaceae bacterium]